MIAMSVTRTSSWMVSPLTPALPVQLALQLKSTISPRSVHATLVTTSTRTQTAANVVTTPVRLAPVQQTPVALPVLLATMSPPVLVYVLLVAQLGSMRALETAQTLAQLHGNSDLRRLRTNSPPALRLMR